MGLYSKTEVLVRYANLEVGWPSVQWTPEIAARRNAFYLSHDWVCRVAEEAERSGYPDLPWPDIHGFGVEREADITWLEAAKQLANI